MVLTKKWMNIVKLVNSIFLNVFGIEISVVFKIEVNFK